MKLFNVNLGLFETFGRLGGLTMDEEEERHLGDWLRSAAGDCGVAKFYETLVILPPTTKQIRHHSLSLSQYLAFVITAFVLATTTLMNLTFEQTFALVHEKTTHKFSHHHFIRAPISFQIVHILTCWSLIMIPQKDWMDENPTHHSFHFTSKY